MKHPFRFVPLTLAFFLLLSSYLVLGQGIVTGSISGTVQDSQGAIVPGAKITATELSTNRTYTTVSTSGGVIALRGLPPARLQSQIGRGRPWFQFRSPR